MPWITKHRRAVLMLGGLGAMLATACWFWHACTPADLRTKVSHIRAGMSVEQVRQIIGCPPGVYRTRAGTPGSQCYQGPRYDEWLFDDGDVMVTYAGLGRAGCFEVYYREQGGTWQPADPPLFDRLTAVLGF